MDPFTLMYLAGHKSLATKMRYIHFAGSHAQTKLQETRRKMIGRAKVKGGHNADTLDLDHLKPMGQSFENN